MTTRALPLEVTGVDQVSGLGYSVVGLLFRRLYGNVTLLYGFLSYSAGGSWVFMIRGGVPGFTPTFLGRVVCLFGWADVGRCRAIFVLAPILSSIRVGRTMRGFGNVLRTRNTRVVGRRG